MNINRGIVFGSTEYIDFYKFIDVNFKPDFTLSMQTYYIYIACIMHITTMMMMVYKCKSNQ